MFAEQCECAWLPLSCALKMVMVLHFMLRIFYCNFFKPSVDFSRVLRLRIHKLLIFDQPLLFRFDAIFLSWPRAPARAAERW